MSVRVINRRPALTDGMFVGALRRHGAPDALYLDNGPTYSGDVLRVACERLGVTLLHPRPGGMFEFAVGGTWGEVVELVVHDVTWDLASGESFTIDEGTWHYRLPAAPDPRP